MTFKIGDTVKYADFAPRGSSEIPGGAVILFPTGNAYTLSKASDDSTFIFTAGVVEDFGDIPNVANAEYKLIYLPDGLTEVDKLTEELWGVRNDALRDDHLWLPALPYDEEHRKVYTALAKHVLDRFQAEDSPLAVKDRDGIVWIQNGKGLYYCEGYESYSFRDRTLAAVEEEFGPLTGAGR